LGLKSRSRRGCQRYGGRGGLCIVCCSELPRCARCVVAPGAPLERRESRDGKSQDLTRMHGSGKPMRVLQVGCRGRSKRRPTRAPCSVVHQGKETPPGTGTKKSAEAALCWPKIIACLLFHFLYGRTARERPCLLLIRAEPLRSPSGGGVKKKVT
jgi:hypothetical protein